MDGWERLELSSVAGSGDVVSALESELILRSNNYESSYSDTIQVIKIIFFQKVISYTVLDAHSRDVGSRWIIHFSRGR